MAAAVCVGIKLTQKDTLSGISSWSVAPMIFFVLPCLVDRFLAAHWFGVEALPRHVINVDISQKVGTSQDIGHLKDWIYVIYVVSRVNFVLKKHIVYPCPTHESFHRRHGLDPWRLTWNIIMEVWKIVFFSNWVIYMFHVHLPGCMPVNLWVLFIFCRVIWHTKGNQFLSPVVP